MEQANSQFEATVKERADNEATQAEEVKRRAEEELDGFYDERTDEVRKRRGRRLLQRLGWHRCPQALAIWCLTCSAGAAAGEECTIESLSIVLSMACMRKP